MYSYRDGDCPTIAHSKSKSLALVLVVIFVVNLSEVKSTTSLEFDKNLVSFYSNLLNILLRDMQNRM